MLPRRAKVEPLPQQEAPTTADAIVEMLQSQIAADRANSRANSRSESRKVIPRKRSADTSPVQSPRKRQKDADDEGPPTPKRATESCGCDAPEFAPPAGTGFSYFDRLTQRSIFDDPLDDFPALRELLHQRP